ncbi:MAG: polyketide synthase dehydratase domain-containing protein [Vicinamibacterales bacterium]
MWSDEAGTLDDTAWTQPALFAVEVALARLWISLGVEPVAVIGHSVGEFAAAHIAGVLTLEAGLQAVATRGALMQALPADGAMCAVAAPESRAADVAATVGGRLAIAAVNGPDQTVLSGEAAAIDRVEAACAEAGIRCQRLRVSHAFHSPLMEPMVAAFRDAMTGVSLTPPRLRLISNVSGASAGPEVATADYWVAHVLAPVRFGEGLRTLAGLRADAWLEVGPHPTLLGTATETPGAPALLVPTLRRGRGDDEQVTDAVAALYRAGARVDWSGLFAGRSPRRVSLATYPFEREPRWFDTAQPVAPAGPAGDATAHPLLGTRLRSAGSEAIFEAQVSPDAPGWVRDHRVQGLVVMPAAAYLEALDAAGRARLGADVDVQDVEIREAMVLEDGRPRTMQVVCGAAVDGGCTATISSTVPGDRGWVTHVTARIALRPAGLDAPPPAGPSDAHLEIPVDVFYEDLRARGIEFGPRFRTLARVRRGADQADAEIRMTAGGDEHAGYGVHPLVLDAAFQALAAAMDGDEGALFLPVGFGRYVRRHTPGHGASARVTLTRSGSGHQRADVRVVDARGVAVEVSDLQLRRVSDDALARLAHRQIDQWLYTIEWPVAPPAASPPPAVPVLAAAADRAAAALIGETGLAEHETFVNTLEAACAVAAATALRALGWSPRSGDIVEPSALMSRLGVEPRHEQLVGRLLAILGESGALTPANGGWRVTAPLPDDDLDVRWQQLLATHPAGRAEVELVMRVSRRLPDILTGRSDALDALFPGGSLDVAERLYRDSVTARFYNGVLADILAAAADGQAPGRPLRVLEVGGGTGGSTAYLLPRLGERCAYTFTDVGPLFVERARARFGSHAGLTCRVLDLERDPEDQGFEPGSADVIVASNVVHATSDVRRTLARLRRLLAPGGLLTMLEVTAPQRWFDLTVGVTPGWWAFTDRDLRPDYPTLPAARWLDVLRETGYDAPIAVPSAGGAELARQSIFLARSAPARRAWVVLGAEDGVMGVLAETLRARGDRCDLVPPDARRESALDARERTGPAGWCASLLDGDPAAGREPATDVVYGWGLDDAAVSDRVVPALEIAQEMVRAHRGARLWIVTRGGQAVGADDRGLDAAQAPLWGLGRTIALEHPELRTVVIDLDPSGDRTDAARVVGELTGGGRTHRWRFGEPSAVSRASPAWSESWPSRHPRRPIAWCLRRPAPSSASSARPQRAARPDPAKWRLRSRRRDSTSRTC